MLVTTILITIVLFYFRSPGLFLILKSKIKQNKKIEMVQNLKKNRKLTLLNIVILEVFAQVTRSGHKKK